MTKRLPLPQETDDLRRIPSLPGYLARRDGQIVGATSGKGRKPGSVLVQGFDSHGYRRVRPWIGGRQKMCSVSRLVCEAFHGQRAGLLVRHLDGNRLNNHASNLAWGTSLDNEADKKRHGRTTIGERSHNAILSDAEARVVIARVAAGESRSGLATELGVSETPMPGQLDPSKMTQQQLHNLMEALLKPRLDKYPPGSRERAGYEAAFGLLVQHNPKSSWLRRLLGKIIKKRGERGLRRTDPRRSP